MNWIVLAALLVSGCTVSPGKNETVDTGGAVGVGQVNMSNIDVSSEVGADRLLRRIRDGAAARCQIGLRLPGEGAAARRQACMRAAMARDVLRVESPVVTARFSRMGEAMIMAAILDDAARASQQTGAIAGHNANSSADLTAPVRPNARVQLTTEELNRRESARLRATIGASSQDAAIVPPEG